MKNLILVCLVMLLSLTANAQLREYSMSNDPPIINTVQVSIQPQMSVNYGPMVIGTNDMTPMKPPTLFQTERSTIGISVNYGLPSYYNIQQQDLYSTKLIEISRMTPRYYKIE